MKTIRLAESVPLSEATTGTPTGRKFRARLIESDIWGSSGYYGREVLEAAARTKVFGQGCQVFLDHPGATEEYDRPERSVRDLAGKLAGDAVFESDGLYADIEVYPASAAVIEGMAEDIGMSIRAFAEVEPGEADGRHGQIIKAIERALSVDFVTKAGAGGKVVAILESARAVEATANDTRAALDRALTDAYGGEHRWVGVRDFDESTIWFFQTTPDSEGLYQLGYSLDEQGAVTLTGSPVEVRVHTEYVPVEPAEESATTDVTVTRPDSTTQESNPKEARMGTIQVDEAEHRRLTETAGRVQAVEAERDQAVTERDEARTERDQLTEANATRDRAATVARIVSEAATAANVELDEDTAAGIATRAVFSDDGAVNEAETRRIADERVARLAETAGHGKPRGLGGPIRSSEAVDVDAELAELDKINESLFGTPVKEA